MIGHCVLVAALSLFGPCDDSPHDVLWGARNGAEAKVFYRIVDPSGVPVTNASVRLYFRTDYPKLKEWQKDAFTDTNGCFVVEGAVNQRIGVGVDCDGYYYSHDAIELRKTKSNPAIIGGKWQPYGESRVVVLKPYINPIEMPGVYRWPNFKVPVFRKWVGFDVEKASWMPPYGYGEHEDLLLRFTYDVRNRYVDFNSTMEVSFTNNPYAGFYEMKIDSSSELKNIYAADTNGAFSVYKRFEFDAQIVDENKQRRLGEDSYIVFRTRTKIDGRGRLVSAHYGKLFGPWGFDTTMGFRMLMFNPNPNDPNLEDLETYRKSRERYERRKRSKYRK